MMIQDRWWQQFLRNNRQGSKVHSYVRTGAAPPKDASMMLFYVTKPVGEMAGYAEFIERKVGEPMEMWKQHGKESAISSREGYEEFIGNSSKVSFIRFKNLREAANPILLKELLMLLDVKRLARNGFYTDQKLTDKLVSIME
jgi:predicted transcriptional regulator